jgi:transposase
MRRSDICLYLGPADRAELEALRTARNTPRKLAWRAGIVLGTADGAGTVEIMRRTGMSKPTVWRWQERYLDEGVPGLKRDKTRPSRVPPLPRDVRLKVIAKTVQETPPNATHWSRATMAEAVGISASSVGRIWADAGLKPHIVKGFKVSNDPMFEEKVAEIVGLYLDPPDRAVVLCVDEKSQIQALDRTQPSLPFRSGRTKTVTHDYKRNGTSTLFAAMNTLNGQVLSMCAPRHRHQEWLRFLQMIDRETTAHVEIHVIADNYGTHKHAKVKKWLTRHPRFHMHFTPTSSSWLNMVERFFRDITTKRIRRGAFPSVETLVQAITNYIAEHNLDPKPFIWTAKAGDILAKVTRARAALANNAPSA